MWKCSSFRHSRDIFLPIMKIFPYGLLPTFLLPSDFPAVSTQFYRISPHLSLISLALTSSSDMPTGDEEQKCQSSIKWSTPKIKFVEEKLYLF